MIHNFSAGPAILPKEVFAQAAQACIDFNGKGLSLLEMSHRTKEFEAVMDEARQLVKDLLNLPNGYSVLFLQGGASTQFAMIPLNLMNATSGKAAYLNTGVWASGAMSDARLYGEIVEVASSADKNFNYIPSGYQVPDDAQYFHITTNNTIYGTRIKDIPNTSIPLVGDMSSEMFSRVIDASKFDLIYAGAQKNMGPAGTTLVIVKDEILGKNGRKNPKMLDYQQQIKGESMLNTPPVFAIYVAMLTMRWLKNYGGVAKIQERNNLKANMLYAELERNSLTNIVVPDAKDRSTMNVTFTLKNTDLESNFMEMAKQAQLHGLKGHILVGGFRASIYNPLEPSSVQALVDVLKEFENKYA